MATPGNSRIEYYQLASAGGGGSSSGGGGGGHSHGGSGGSSDPIALVIWLIAVIVFFVVSHKTKAKTQELARQKKEKVDRQLAIAADSDQSWNSDYIRSGAGRVFGQYQSDWANFNTDNMKAYLSSRYYQHACLMMEAMRGMNRRNVTSVKAPVEVNIENVDDRADNSGDNFTALMSAPVDDQIIDIRNNRLIYQSNYGLSEHWRFVRSGNSWVLDGINPCTADMSTFQGQLRQFAESNNAFYSLDWGYLLLPERGQLFSGGRFGISDINNHVIGRLGDTGHIQLDELIYQIYTYSEYPANETSAIYLIGQISVPKYYDDIVIRRHKSMSGNMRGFEKVELEWGDFNDKFDVYVTRPEQVTTFELLNPQMMERLDAAPFEINIEVVDNTIYFYAPLRNIGLGNYREMLSILQAAYRELKM